MWKAEEKERIPSKKKSEKEGQETERKKGRKKSERSAAKRAKRHSAGSVVGDSSIDLLIDCGNLLLTVTP
jgi:hypothetical protein